MKRSRLGVRNNENIKFQQRDKRQIYRHQRYPNKTGAGTPTKKTNEKFMISAENQTPSKNYQSVNLSSELKGIAELISSGFKKIQHQHTQSHDQILRRKTGQRKIQESEIFTSQDFGQRISKSSSKQANLKRTVQSQFQGKRVNSRSRVKTEQNSIKNRNQYRNTNHRQLFSSQSNVVKDKTLQSFAEDGITKSIHSKTQEDQLFSHNRRDFTYNKWYIKPQFRMKKPIKVKTQSYQDIQTMYNGLYEQKMYDPKKPFQEIYNSRLQILEKLNANNINLLSVFRMRQQQRRKRVPRIISMILGQNIKS